MDISNSTSHSNSPSFGTHLRICAAGTHLNSGYFCTMPHFTIKFRDRSTGYGRQNIWNQVSKRLISWFYPGFWIVPEWYKWEGTDKRELCSFLFLLQTSFYKTFIPVLLLTPKSCYLTVLKNNKTQDTGCRLGTHVIAACKDLIEGQGEKVPAYISQSLSTATLQ